MIVRLTRHGMVAAVVLGAAIISATAAGAEIGFMRNGPFEVCLNSTYAAWLRHQAEFLVNGDKRGRSLNDVSVVAWTASTLDDCRKREKRPLPQWTAFGITWCGGEIIYSSTRKVSGGEDCRTRPRRALSVGAQRGGRPLFS